MQPALALAAFLLVGVSFAHSYLGERYILIRLFRRPRRVPEADAPGPSSLGDNLPKLRGSDWFTKMTLRFAWHLTSVAWTGLAAALFVEPRLAVSLTFAVHFLIVLVASRGRHYAWAVFGAVALLTWPW